ncbi:response regulator [Candidatus Saccharibacteria bacterium]|nr:response regulator [Candidatus Saccharibacteria bacterium]
MTRKLIYIIEDDQVLAAHFVRTLKNHTTETFTNGIDAIKRIDQQLPDLIILDVIIDGPSAFSLLHELQSYTDTAQIPIIICSSLDLTQYDLTLYGVVRVLDKSTMHPDDLVEAVSYAR